MSNPTDSIHNLSLLAQCRERLSEFFEQSSVKKLVSVLVPSALAAALLPVFGPAVAGTAAAVAAKNSLKLLKIDMSTDTIEKLLKPLEGEKLSEDEMQQVLGDTLEQLLPADKRVNEETAKALVIVAPTIKEAALSNARLDVIWLAESMETNLKQQGEMMEKIAPDFRVLMQKDGEALAAEVQRLLQNWSNISLEVSATNKGEISDLDLKAKARGGAISHRLTADSKGAIKGVKTDFEVS